MFRQVYAILCARAMRFPTVSVSQTVIGSASNSREAYILFLRKTAEIDKPYYTLEVEPNGTIRQKRTYFDRQNEDLKDAEKFLKEWQKVVSERLTESDREKAEKSKVLRLQEFEQLRQDDIRIHTGDLAGQRLVDVLVSDLMETAA